MKLIVQSIATKCYNTCLVLLFISVGNLLTASNFNSFVEIITLGGTQYDVKGSDTGNPFSGSLGNFTEGGSLILSAGLTKTFKESRNGCIANVCGGTLQWQVLDNGLPLTIVRGDLSSDPTEIGYCLA